MQPLIPFNYTLQDLNLKASITRDEALIKIHYQIADEKNLLNLPQKAVSLSHELNREDGLWNSTCFELFLRPMGESSYYEFNFSLTPAWNQYFFESYRLPQPPTACHQFLLKSYSWDGKNLTITLEGLNPQQTYEASLTAVLKETSGPIHYMALNHAGLEPDFHNQNSFIKKI